MLHLARRVACYSVSLAGLLAVGGAAAIAGPAPFTIDQVLQAPYPTSLVVAPSGTAAAWVFDARGVRNIWVGDAAGAVKSRQITNYTQDDGNDAGELAWSSDARLIAYTRGQTLEDDAPANVISAPGGPSSREIWMVPVAGGEPRKIGLGHSPSFSPAGGQLIFLDKRQIIGVDLQGGAAPHPLIVDEGNIRSTTWSPDGRRIAFVSQRRGHALVGVYDLQAKTVTWLAPDFDLDSNPVFSPDGSKLAFVRSPVEKVQAFVAHRSGRPWSIWIADVATGTGRPVWTADAGTGSVFHSTLSARNLLWTAGGQLVFPWEKTGWMLPYALSAAGGQPRPLASGSFEVAYMTLSPDGRRLVYASNQNDIDRLHVWTADPSSGPARPVASGEGIEAFPEVAPDGTIFALRSSATKQLSPAVFRAGQWQPLAAETPFPSTALVTPQSVTFKASDGQTVHGQLFLPRGGSVGPHPALLFFHGGPSRQMLVGFHYMSAYSWMYALNEYFAAKGYVVLSVNYRGGIGYGLDYREAKDFGVGGGSETNDLLGAVSYMQGRHDVDAKRLGIWGGSYGGLMTALGLARASDAFAAGVDYAGVYNWASMLATLGAPIDDPAARARAIASSPIATIDRWRSPVLVVQADDDRNVPFSQSTELVEDLRAHGIEHETLILPNEVHDLTRYSSWLTLFTATDDFLSRHLLGLQPHRESAAVK